MSSRRWAIVPACVFAVVLLVHAFSPNATPFDSRWTVHTARSLIHEGNTDLNEYLPLLEEHAFYGIECVEDTGLRKYPVRSAEECSGGRFVHFYPVAVPVLVAPALWLVERSLEIAQPALRPVAESLTEGTRRRLLLGDVIGSSMALELLMGSTIVAGAAAVVYLIGRMWLGLPGALFLTGIFAFCTSAWSTASRALWQHGPSMLLISCALLITLVGCKQPRVLRWAGVPLALAVFVRPTNAIIFIAVSCFVALRSRKVLPAYILATLPVVLGFVLLTWSTYGSVIAPYAMARRANSDGLSLHPELFTALAGNLISPSRGLFVYSPVLLFALIGVFAWKKTEYRLLHALLAASVAGHYILISCFETWWAGDSYGPRYFSDVTPILVYFLIPAVGRMRWGSGAAYGLIVLALYSGLVHYRGAVHWATMQWNVLPVRLREDPGRLWDWRDPQWLRGLNRPVWIAAKKPIDR